MKSFVTQYVVPLLIVLVFAVALVAVSARAFLPNDMAAPAPVNDLACTIQSVTV
ncbi:MAG: hypothetical protein AAF974_06215 [Cyanobacteria bacterium P01_E01_bin.34]